MGHENGKETCLLLLVQQKTKKEEQKQRGKNHQKFNIFKEK